MRLAMVASNVIRIPPDPPAQYVPQGWSGAPEMVVSLITEELVKRGHQVTLFASGDSKTKAALESILNVATSSTEQFKDHRDYEEVLISKAYQMAAEGQFDLLHSHFDTRTAPFAPLVDVPTISTLHSPLEGKVNTILQYFKKTQYYVSISDAQRKPLADLNYTATIHHGIDITHMPFSKEKEDYLLFSGRLIPAKGVAEAIKVAKRTKNRLIILGSVDLQSPYWLNNIKPEIDNQQIIYKGFVTREDLFQYYAKAKAFVFPVQWEEPFGLVTIEAMATGTPTIAFARGSLPEIIDQGKTGFLCHTVEDMEEAVKKIGQINPLDCRKKVEDFFTVEKMVDKYEQSYYNILKP